MCVAVPTDDGRNSYVFNGARTTKSTRTIFLPRTLRQSLSCVLIPFPCVLPGSRVEFCQWCTLVRCSPFCLTFLFVPFAPRHHRADRCWPSAGLRGGQLAVSCSLDCVWSLAIAGGTEDWGLFAPVMCLTPSSYLSSWMSEIAKEPCPSCGSVADWRASVSAGPGSGIKSCSG